MSERAATSATIAVLTLGLCVWVVVPAASQVTITEYSAGITAGSLPSGIAAGSEGALWFTEY
jgi:streptogramin lyase